MNFNYILALFFVPLLFNVNIAFGSEHLDISIKECRTPLIEPQGKLFLCGAESVTLSVAIGMTSYQWFKNDIEVVGASEESLIVSEAGLYKVVVLDGNSCEMTSEASEVLQVLNDDPLPFENLTTINGVKTEAGFKFCEGERIEISVLGNFSGYVWTGGENNLSSSVTISEPGSYTIAARVSQGCALTRTVSVTTYAIPAVEIESSDSIFSKGESISLYASGAEEFSWFPTEGLDNPNIANPQASPERTITYTVIGTASNGCNNTAEVTLFLDDSRIDLLPPKVFSANREEFYIIEHMENYPNVELVIFNRQGLEVFKAKPYLNDWNGSFKGALLPKGDYYFIMRGQGEKNLKTGSILLLR